MKVLPFRAFGVALLAAATIAAVFIAEAEDEDESFETWPEKLPKGKIDFERDVRPLLIINCLECHNNEKAKENGLLSLETKELAMTTGIHPPVLVPGSPEKSLLVQVLTLDPIHQRAMPPTPDKIWGVRMEILKRWIREGAEWPENVRLVHPKELK